MQIVRTAVIQEDGKRFVECEIASGNELPILVPPSEYIRFRLAVDQEGDSRLTDCLVQALQGAQNLIGEQILPLQVS